ncbi:MAG: L-glutamate gamma-semialdehyde dehydrogenase [Candidatus Velthaea sp.]|jgi:1-pyrroline-5-carboxylate dehydrogenase
MPTTASTLSPFRNEPVRSFRDPAERAAMEAALVAVRATIGRRYPLVIDGERIDGAQTLPSVNPARPAEIIGDVVAATLEDASRALDAATRAFPAWSKTSFAERAALLVRAAAAIRSRKNEFNALMVLEVGKTWVEADADTAEAIDFLEYYAREALALANPSPLTPSPLPESNELRYLPLGVGAIIPPWNFALAIMAGMTSAALVTGNTVVLKPSPDAAVVAAWFVDLMHELGVPAGVLNYVPGDGPSVGEAIVTDARTRFIAFTGSKAVGLRINELAAHSGPGQRWIKRVIAELGGKDAIVVAADADLDAAADGVIASAFGFSGQKCSACSRAIVDRRVYDRLVTTLAAKAKALAVGDPALATTDVGPVINERSAAKISAYLEVGRTEGRLVAGGHRLAQDGYYFEPTIFADVAPGARLAQEEIFGPVLSVIPAADFEQALAIANDTEFGLTGAVYTSDPARIRQAREEFFVGNLYINRKCTGALVGVHPFGGFNLSGTDSKAGGADYLLLFVQSQAIAVSKP